MDKKSVDILSLICPIVIKAGCAIFFEPPPAQIPALQQNLENVNSIRTCL